MPQTFFENNRRCVGRRNYVYFYGVASGGFVQYSCSAAGSLLLLTAWADRADVRAAAARCVGGVGAWQALGGLYLALVRRKDPFAFPPCVQLMRVARTFKKKLP